MQRVLRLAGVCLLLGGVLTACHGALESDTKSTDSHSQNFSIPEIGAPTPAPSASPTPTPIGPGGPLAPETHQVDGKTKRDPYRVSVTQQTALYQHFAANIQPILQGTSADSTPTNSCVGCHTENRFNMVNFKVCSGDYAIDPNCIERNYWQFLGKGMLNFEKVEGSWALGVLRGHDGAASVDNGVPGLYHMDKNFVIGQGPIYQAFKTWINLERQTRTPQGIGEYSSQPHFLCWIARKPSDFDMFSSNGLGRTYMLSQGAHARIYCQPVGNDHRLTGTAVDISALMQPPITEPYQDIQGLVSNYAQGGSNLKLYTGLLRSTTNETTYNSIAITVAHTGDQITGATWEYVLNTASQNSGSVRVRTDELGSQVEISSRDVPTDVLPGDTLVFQSERGAPSFLNPPFPDPAHPAQQDPQIELTTKIGFPDSYHQFFRSQQIFFADTSGNAKMLFPSWGNFVQNAVTAPDGKMYSQTWDNKFSNSLWSQQFVPDLRYGTPDLSPPFLNKTRGVWLGASLGLQAVDLMGNLMVEQGGAGPVVELQIGRHDLGVLFFTSDATDQAPAVQTFRTTGLCTYGVCPGGSATIPFIDRRPVRAPGYGFYFATAEEPFNLLTAPPVAPHNLGIAWADHQNRRRVRVLNIPTNNPQFPNGYFVDGIAVLGERQVPPSFVPDDTISDPRLATIHIPNVAGRLVLKQPHGFYMEGKFNEISAAITHVRVFRMQPNVYAQNQFSSIAHAARGGLNPVGNTHNSFGASEFINSAMLLAEVPVQSDGSVAFTFPAGVGLFMQYLTTVNTNKGPLLVAMNQEAQIIIPKPGYNEISAAKDFNAYRADCMRCHGSPNAYLGIESMTRSPGGTITPDNRNTLAMQRPVSLGAQAVGRFADYVTMVKPHLEAMQCTYCHGRSIGGGLPTPTDPNHHDSYYPSAPDSPAGNLSFEPRWHATASEWVYSAVTPPDVHDGPNDSIRWTNKYPACRGDAIPPCPGQELTYPLAGQAMGPEAPYEPGYVLLQRWVPVIPGDPWNERVLYLGQETGYFNGQGVSSGNVDYTHPGGVVHCSLFLYSLGVNVNCPTNPQDIKYFDRQPFAAHLPAGWPTVSDPLALPYSVNHNAMASDAQLLQMAQDFERAASIGWDYRMDFKEPAPSYSPFAGQTRMGLTLQTSQ